MLSLIVPAESAAERTLASRLMRAGLDTRGQASQADTEAWLETLCLYEDLRGKATRMATFLVDDEQALPDAQYLADDRAYARLAGAVEDWQAHGAIGRAMIDRLAALLDRIEGLAMEDVAGWQTGVSRYLGLRYGPLPRPLPPGAWSWRHTLRAWQIEGWGQAIVCRQIHRILSPRQREQAVADFGAFQDRDGNDHPLWLMGWPQREQDALDRRAASLGADPRGRELLAHRERLRRLAAMKAQAKGARR